MTKVKEIAIRLFGDTEPCKCGGSHEVCLKCNVCRANRPDRAKLSPANLASGIDATVLKAEATEADVRALCHTALKYSTASVCINSHFIPLARKLLNGSVLTCTVINFPLGSGSPEAISAEAGAVLEAGVDEVDMVQNLSALFSGDIPSALDSIAGVAEQCADKHATLKVIIETCYLSEEQLITSCLIAKKAGADFVKTSTGFGTGGATAENIRLMREIVGPKLGVKASGGVRTKEQALEMVASGADRIGASNVMAIVE